MRGDYLVALSYLRSWQGNYKEEIATSRLAQHLPPLPDPRQAALFHAKVIELEAEGQFYLDDLKASERGYRAFLALVEEAHARWPGDNFILGLVARGRWNLGVTLEQQKRFDEALPILAKGADDARQAFEFDPLDREAMRSHRIVDQAYAQNLAYLRRLDEALAILRPYEAKAEQAWQVGPKDPSRLRDYAMAVTMVGEAQGVGGDPNGGCQTDARALGLYGRLKQMGRLSGFDADYNIGQVKQRDVKFCSGVAP